MPGNDSKQMKNERGKKENQRILWWFLPIQIINYMYIICMCVYMYNMYNIIYLLHHRQKPVIVNSHIWREFTNYEISVYIRTFEPSLVAHYIIISIEFDRVHYYCHHFVVVAVCLNHCSLSEQRISRFVWVFWIFIYMVHHASTPPSWGHCPAAAALINICYQLRSPLCQYYCYALK